MDWRRIAALIGGIAGLMGLAALAIVFFGTAADHPRGTAPAPSPALFASAPTLLPSEAQPSGVMVPGDPAERPPPMVRLGPMPSQEREEPSTAPPETTAAIVLPRRKAMPSVAALSPGAVDQVQPAEPIAKMPGRRNDDPEPRAVAKAPAPPLNNALGTRPIPDRRLDGVLTPSEVARLRMALRLTADQEPYWRPVEPVLIEIGRQQMAQVQAGQKPDFSLSFAMQQRLYFAAAPLLRSLREDQKAEIRRRARSMGLERVASYI